jgi:hypothetical protein
MSSVEFPTLTIASMLRSVRNMGEQRFQWP